MSFSIILEAHIFLSWAVLRGNVFSSSVWKIDFHLLKFVYYSVGLIY